MIVADCTLIAHLFIDTADTELARTVVRADDEWTAPSLWGSEFRNVLTKYVRADRLALHAALEAAVVAEQFMAPGVRPVSSVQVLTLAASSGCSAYDAEYVVLARALRVPLVTSDQRLTHLFPTLAVTPGDFLARRVT